jgi:hypothetical protein
VIVQVPRGGAAHRALTEAPPPSVVTGAVVVEAETADDEGAIEAPAAGQVVISVPSPEELEHEAATVRRVLGQAGTGVQPLIVVVQAAEELREEELAAVLQGAAHTSRAVIVRVIRDP